MPLNIKRVTLGSGTPDPTNNINAAASADGYYLSYSSVSPFLFIYKRASLTTTTYLTQAGTGLSVSGSARRGGWSFDGKYYAMNNGTIPAAIYKRTAGTDSFVQLTGSKVSAIDQATASRAIQWSRGEPILLVSQDATPFISAYRYDDTTDVFTKITLNFSTAPAARTFHSAISNDGKWLALTTISGINVYRIDRNTATNWTLTKMAQTTGRVQVGQMWNAVFHPTEPMFIATSSGANGLLVYEILNDSQFREVGITAPADTTTTAGGRCDWSWDGQYVAYLGSTQFFFWKFDLPTRTFSYISSGSWPNSGSFPQPNSNPGSGDVAFSPDGLTLVISGAHTTAGSRTQIYSLGEAIMSNSFGSLSMDVGVKDPDAVLLSPMSFSALTQDGFGYSGASQVPDLEYDYSSVGGTIYMDQLVQTPAQQITRLVNVDVSFGPISEDLSAVTKYKIPIEMSFGSFTESAFIAGKGRATLDQTFGSLTTAALSGPIHTTVDQSFKSLSSVIVAGPFHAWIDQQFGALTVTAEGTKDNIQAIIDTVSFGALEADALLIGPGGVVTRYSFGQFTSQGEINVPVGGFIDKPAFGKLTTEGELEVPIGGPIAMRFGSLSMDFTIPASHTGRVAVSFGQFTSEGSINVPQAIWVTNSFGGLTTDALVNVPRTMTIEQSFSPLSTVVDLINEIFVDTRMVFGSLSMELRGPIQLRMPLVAPKAQGDGELKVYLEIDAGLTAPKAISDVELRARYLVNIQGVAPKPLADFNLKTRFVINADVVGPKPVAEILMRPTFKFEMNAVAPKARTDFIVHTRYKIQQDGYAPPAYFVGGLRARMPLRGVLVAPMPYVEDFNMRLDYKINAELVAPKAQTDFIIHARNKLNGDFVAPKPQAEADLRLRLPITGVLTAPKPVLDLRLSKGMRLRLDLNAPRAVAKMRLRLVMDLSADLKGIAPVAALRLHNRYKLDADLTAPKAVTDLRLRAFYAINANLNAPKAYGSAQLRTRYRLEVGAWAPAAQLQLELKAINKLTGDFLAPSPNFNVDGYIYTRYLINMEASAPKATFDGVISPHEHRELAIDGVAPKAQVNLLLNDRPTTWRRSIYIVS